MSAILVTVTVTAANTNKNEISDYTVSVKNLKNIPKGGAIEIKYPASLTPLESGCRNDIIGGSQLSSNGFECNLDTTTRTLVIYGFDKFIGPADVKIKIRMMNPASASGTWDYNTYY